MVAKSKGGKKTAADKPISEKYSGDNVRASWPFSLHNIRTNISHCSPEGKEALVSAFLWCTDVKHPIHRDDFAHRVGKSPNTLYKLYTGKYLHPTTKRRMDVPSDLILAIKNFIAIERERYLGGQNEFVMTPTAKRIYNACDLARESRTPVFITSPSHIGKTWALEHYTANNNHGRTVYCRMKAASGLGGMVKRMCSRLGVSPESNTASLVDRIKNALTVDMLLILDEVHLLQYTYRKQSFFGCMEVIREILDEVGCGMVFCGTLLFLEKLEEGAHKEMEQLLRRGVHRTRLANMPTIADLKAVLAHCKLTFPARDLVVEVAGIEDKPRAVIRELAKKQGLKAITERLRYGRKIATRRKQKLSWEHFIEAHLSIETEAIPEDDWS